MQQIDDLMRYDASEEYTENPIHFHKVLAPSLPTSVDPGSQHIYFAKGEEKTFMYVANNQGELEPISAPGAGGEKGDKGDKGDTGNGIVSITDYYATTTTQIAPSASAVTSTTIPTLSETDKYLWRKEVIAFTEGAPKTSVALLAAYGDKGDPGAQGEQGQSYTTEIRSSNGSVFRYDNISTTLECRVLRNTEDITDELPDSSFMWKRNSGNPVEDERWNTSSKAIAHKTIEIGPEDCIGRTVFLCEVEI